MRAPACQESSHLRTASRCGCRRCARCAPCHAPVVPRLQVSGEREFFGPMVVEAVTKLDPATLDLRMLGIKKVQVCAVVSALGAGVGGWQTHREALGPLQQGWKQTLTAPLLPEIQHGAGLWAKTLVLHFLGIGVAASVVSSSAEVAERLHD